MQIWTHLTDLNTQQQAAAICMALKGRAQRLIRQLSPQEIQHGGTIDGVQLDPVSYIFTVLAIQFTPLDDKSKVQTMAQLWTLDKLPGEDISRAFHEYCIYRCQNWWKALFWSNQIDSA